MASNFDFLEIQFPEIFTYATHARFTLEQAVLWLYDNDAYLKPPYDDNLGALIHEQTFKDNLNLVYSPRYGQFTKSVI